MSRRTTDTFFKGRIKVKQNPGGYRFSIDAVLLANYANPRPGSRVIDLGTGCGIIPMILTYRVPKIKIYGVEVQDELAGIAVLNAKENNMDDNIDIFCMDMKELKCDMFSGPVDMVICNPPYRKVKSGRINPDPQRAVARHEIKATLSDVVETAGRLLRIAGKFIAVYPAERLTDMLVQMRCAGIEPKSLRTIHSGYNKEAKLILIEGSKGGRTGIKIARPLTIYYDDGSYTDEVKQMFLP